MTKPDDLRGLFGHRVERSPSVLSAQAAAPRSPTPAPSVWLGLPRLHRADAIARTELAARITRLGARVAADGLRVVHADSVPLGLVRRLAPSFGASWWMLDPASDRPVGLVGSTGAPPSTETVVALAKRWLARGLVVGAVTSTEHLQAERVSYLEVEGDDGTSLRLFLLAEAMPCADCRTTIPTRDALPIEVGIVVARAALRVGELRSFEIGDVLVLEPSERHAPRGVVDGSEMELELCERGGAFVVVGRKGRETMERPSSSDDGAGLARIEDARIEVSVEVARVATSLAELDALSVGAVLVAGRVPSGAVTLRVGGRSVARGELVDVDGELGVRITELATPGAAQ